MGLKWLHINRTVIPSSHYIRTPHIQPLWDWAVVKTQKKLDSQIMLLNAKISLTSSTTSILVKTHDHVKCLRVVSAAAFSESCVVHSTIYKEGNELRTDFRGKKTWFMRLVILRSQLRWDRSKRVLLYFKNNTKSFFVV